MLSKPNCCPHSSKTNFEWSQCYRSDWFWAWLGLSLFGVLFVLPLSCFFCSCCFWAKQRKQQRSMIYSTLDQSSKLPHPNIILAFLTHLRLSGTVYVTTQPSPYVITSNTHPNNAGVYVVQQPQSTLQYGQSNPAYSTQPPNNPNGYPKF